MNIYLYLEHAQWLHLDQALGRHQPGRVPSLSVDAGLLQAAGSQWPILSSMCIFISSYLVNVNEL
jgi:hypothetical protein